MKKISFFLMVILVTFAFAACDKEDNEPGNYFSYEGKNYMIDSAFVIEWVINSGMENEFTINQFLFTSVSGPDTTQLLIAVYDTLSNVLSGNYTSLDQVETETASRGILPYGFIFYSVISINNGYPFFTGKGGSLDVSVTNGNYSIKFNDISAGLYGDLLDDDVNGNSEYTETGKIGGQFNGIVEKYTEVFSKKSTKINPLFEKLIQEKISQMKK